MVANQRRTPGAETPACRSRSAVQGNGVIQMLDLFYVAIGCGFVLVCWAFTKACDKL